MSISTPTSTDPTGNPIQGTSGTSIGNNTSNLGTNEFLSLMMDQLKYQNPASPTDPSSYLQELAEMSSVEQATTTASSTTQTAASAAVSSAVGLIGDTVTYTDETTGKPVSGTVQSVQITSGGPTLTVDGVAGVAPSLVTAVTSGSSSTAAGAS